MLIRLILHENNINPLRINLILTIKIIMQIIIIISSNNYYNTNHSYNTPNIRWTVDFWPLFLYPHYRNGNNTNNINGTDNSHNA